MNSVHKKKFGKENILLGTNNIYTKIKAQKDIPVYYEHTPRKKEHQDTDTCHHSLVIFDSK